MWSDPPTFVEDGTPLPAASLNILSDNAAWLYNQVRRIVPAMPVYRVPWVLDYQYLEQVQAQYRIRHVGRYLRARIYGTKAWPIPAGDNDRPGWQLYYDGRLILEDLWPDGNTTNKWVKDYELDLQALLPGLEIGIRYQLYAVPRPNSRGDANSYFELSYLYEVEQVA
jgi:hypothetical protein